jgi:mannose-6-phosphate isomerase class I
MKNNIPIMLTDWDSLPKEIFKGEKGVSYWRTVSLEGIRMRIVEHSEDFTADHWCEKGHIIYCVEGEITIKFKDGTSLYLEKGKSVILPDSSNSHFVTSEKGAELFIVDGDFLI